MARTMNEWTGRSTQSLRNTRAKMLRALKDLHESEEELGGGSPFEGIYDRLDAIESELKRRGDDLT